MDGAIAVVTGASRGIGEHVARRFAAAGAHVVACARDADDLASVAGDIRDGGGTVTDLRADVRDEFDLERVMERAAREGGIDVLVANAGVYHGDPGETPLLEASYSAFDDHLRTNARGVFATVREAAPHLDDHARILIPTGPFADGTAAGYGAYGVSKAAAAAVGRTVAAETDYPVGLLDPGQVATALGGGEGHDPADAAEMVYWAAADVPAADLDGALLTRRDWRRATE